MLFILCLLICALLCHHADAFSSKTPTVQIYPDIEKLGVALCKEVVEAYSSSVASRGCFHLAIPGGSILNMLSALDGKSDIDWKKCTMSYVNHRCVPLNEETSTHEKAQDLFLKSWQEQGLKVFTLSGSTDAVNEATLYSECLKEIEQNEEGLPLFDLSLIGAGLDGHVGSLYPDSEAIKDTSGATVLSVIKPSSSSITLSLPVMLASREIVVASGGSSKKYPLGKAEGMVRALEADETPVTYPAMAFRHKAKWLMDSGAAGLLKNTDDYSVM